MELIIPIIVGLSSGVLSSNDSILKNCDEKQNRHRIPAVDPTAS
jgi:hypothetical protein